MDISQIPKSFWHSISICLLATTFGLLFIAYRSSTVSIEFADTKIELSTALARAEIINSDLQRKAEKLNAFASSIAELDLRNKETGAKEQKDFAVCEMSTENLSHFGTIDPSVFEDLRDMINRAQNSLESK